MSCRRRILCQSLLAIALAAVGAVAAAEEPVLQFLHAAQDQGYGEIAIDYLQRLKAAGRVPPELAQTFDLELSRSYRVAVAEAFNPAEAQERTAKAQAYLDKFLKEHADHPEVARAIESWGDMALDRAITRIRLASGTRDKAQQEKQLTAARADLEEARPRFADAVDRYSKRYAELKQSLADDASKRGKATAAGSKKQRQAQEKVRDAEFDWLECRFKLAKIDFYSGQTWLDEKSPKRKAALQAAAKAFDAIFQRYRESLVGLHAHLWHGRAVDELGDDILALDIYDEVLATAPEGRERAPALEPLFAQVQYQRFLVEVRKDGLDNVLQPATAWLDAHKSWSKFDGYQGVVLLVAKAELAAAAKLKGARNAPSRRSP